MLSVLFVAIAAITIFIITYRYSNNNQSAYKFITNTATSLYNKYAPYSFKEIRQKVKDLGREYTTRQYIIQIAAFAIGAAVVSFLYFYNVIISIIYVILAVSCIPYLTYLRCKREYSEFIFEQIQVYTTNTIMEFAVTQSFVKALEGVYESGVLEDPVKSDVKMMIDMAYENGTIEQSIAYMNEKYDFHIVRNMHQLFLQITNEGSKDSGESLENMSQDIDMLVESVYRDRVDRQTFHKKFLTFGIVLYFMIMLVQVMIGVEKYHEMLNEIWVQLLLHLLVIINTVFLIGGEKYYNEDVGAE